jgi:hypothetical protein
MKYMDALKKYNEGNDKWCMPRKGSEDYFKIISMMKKISNIQKSKSKNSNYLQSDIHKRDIQENNRHIKLLQDAIKKQLTKNNKSISGHIIMGSEKESLVANVVSKAPSYNSGSRVFSSDIYKHHHEATKIQHFLKNKLIVNKNILINRINYYKLIKEKLVLLHHDDCLTKKTFNGVNGFTIRNIINLEKKIGTKSKYGAIYLTSIPKIIGVYPIASKVMKNDSDNINEVQLMSWITNEIILKKVSKHFLMIYGNCTCSKRIADKLKLVSINELADGDLKMLINMKEVVGNNEIMFNILFQTFISIATFHNIVGYTHRDAHYGNFLYQNNNEKGYYHYIFNGKDYYLKSTKCNIIIFDYGFSQKILPYTKDSPIALINKQNKKITEDYQRIINAFFNKKSGGWGKFPKLPKEHTNSKMLDIAIILEEIYDREYAYNTGDPNYVNRVFGSIIQNIFLRYTPKDMFITNQPPNIINSTPFRID